MIIVKEYSVVLCLSGGVQLRPGNKDRPVNFSGASFVIMFGMTKVEDEDDPDELFYGRPLKG
jgi:hypothetical protein